MSIFFNSCHSVMPAFDIAKGNAENTYFNFALAHMQAQSMLYMTSVFGNLCQYPGLSNMNYNLQSLFNMPQTYTPNPFGMWQNPFGQFNFDLPFGPNFGKKPNGKKDDKAETAADRKLQAKIDKLSCLLEQISGDKDFLGSKKAKEIKDKIEDAKSLETRKEQYNALVKVYESIDAEAMRSFLVNVRLIDDFNSDDAEEVKDLLQSAGYEDGDERRTRHSEIKDSLGEINSWINSLDDANGNATECPIITHLSTKNYEILDLVSEWNTQQKTNIISVMAAKYNELKDADRKKQFYDSTIGVLVKALVKEASDTIALKIDGKKALDADKIKEIKELQEKLNNARPNNLSALADSFNKLYALLRIEQTRVAGEKVKSYYDFLDTADDTVFDDNLFMKDTLDDLENEKIKVPNNSNRKENPVNSESNPSNSTTENSTSTSSSMKLTETQKAEAETLAKDIVESLRGLTDWENAEGYLDKIGKDNVLEVLHQYNKEVRHGHYWAGGPGHIWERAHGFFRQLITEYGTDGSNEDYAKKIIDKLVEHLNEVKETLDSTKAEELQRKIDKINDIKNKGLTRGTCCSLDKYIEQTYDLLN